MWPAWRRRMPGRTWISSVRRTQSPRRSMAAPSSTFLRFSQLRSISPSPRLFILIGIRTATLEWPLFGISAFYEGIGYDGGTELHEPRVQEGSRHCGYSIAYRHDLEERSKVMMHTAFSDRMRRPCWIGHKAFSDSVGKIEHLAEGLRIVRFRLPPASIKDPMNDMRFAKPF